MCHADDKDNFLVAPTRFSTAGSRRKFFGDLIFNQWLEESNPGRLSVKLESCLCAKVSPYKGQLVCTPFLKLFRIKFDLPLAKKIYRKVYLLLECQRVSAASIVSKLHDVFIA